MEQFKQSIVQGYEISNHGNVRRIVGDGYKEIKGSIQNRGYRYFQTRKKGVRRNHLFHHLVAYAFIGERPEGLVIDHIDRNKLNNHISNLRYISFGDNIRNCHTYRDDIKEKGQTRANLLLNENRQRVRESKKYICDICPLLVPHMRGGGVFGDKRQYDGHMKSRNHLLREGVVNAMRVNGIDVCASEYKKIKSATNNFNRGSRNIKPLIYLNDFY